MRAQQTSLDGFGAELWSVQGARREQESADFARELRAVRVELAAIVHALEEIAELLSAHAVPPGLAQELDALVRARRGRR